MVLNLFIFHSLSIQLLSFVELLYQVATASLHAYTPECFIVTFLAVLGLLRSILMVCDTYKFAQASWGINAVIYRLIYWNDER